MPIRAVAAGVSSMTDGFRHSRDDRSQTPKRSRSRCGEVGQRTEQAIPDRKHRAEIGIRLVRRDGMVDEVQIQRDHCRHLPFDLVYGECCGRPALLASRFHSRRRAPPLPCTPDPVTGQCPALTLVDADPSEEGGQPGQSCDNGATFGTTTVMGIIKGPNVTVSYGQHCTFTSPGEIQGSLTVDGVSVYLNCTLDRTSI
jgi:hypothetical protein